MGAAMEGTPEAEETRAEAAILVGEDTRVEAVIPAGEVTRETVVIPEAITAVATQRQMNGSSKPSAQGAR